MHWMPFLATLSPLPLAFPAPLTLPAAPFLPTTQGTPPTEPYELLDNVAGSFVQLATFPVRPMALDEDGNLWAVNHHDSTLELFRADFLPPAGEVDTPELVIGMPWSPGSVAIWEKGPGVQDDEVLVVCRATWGIVGVDPATGAFTRFIQPREGGLSGGSGQAPPAGSPLDVLGRMGEMAEPADIVVAGDRAFVSCMGADAVVQIDLTTSVIERVYRHTRDNLIPSEMQIKSPLFLSVDDAGRVLVAPLHSGNGSRGEGSGFVSDLVLQDPDLPDADLFRIDPAGNGGQGTVEVVANGTGTILFAHGFTAAGVFWQLNTFARNDVASLQSERDLKGQFSLNRLTKIPDLDAVPQVQNTVRFDDRSANGVDFSIAQPFGLAFAGTGHAFVTGLGSNVLAVVNANGVPIEVADLGANAIPRAVVVSPADDFLHVYCWGTNEIQRFQFDAQAPAGSMLTSADSAMLSHDPTPAGVADGRRLFFDASNSLLGQGPPKDPLLGNLSCATCHVEGGSDFLAWNLSGEPLDRKGVMVTQTLVGLDRLAPFHWRGERQLVDFNTHAFPGLLGGESLPLSPEFDNFQKYLFSLTNPANPNQYRERRLIDDPEYFHPEVKSGSAIQGKFSFSDPESANVNNFSCSDCHALPTGTNNDIVVDQESGQFPRRNLLKPTPFHELWRKHQERVTLTGGEERAFLGSGFNHVGTSADLYDFVDLVTGTFGGAEHNDITQFVHQFDQGLAPAVHFGYFLDQAEMSDPSFANTETRYIYLQAVAGHCDSIVITHSLGGPGPPTPLRWYLDRNIGGNRPYVCEDATSPNRGLNDFRNAAASGLETSLFLGLPLGMGRRFAIDYDQDGTLNLVDLYPDQTSAAHEPAVPGIDYGGTPPVFLDPPTIAWEEASPLTRTSSKTTRLTFRTDRPTKYIIRYKENAFPATQQTIVADSFSETHAVMLKNLRPSTDREGCTPQVDEDCSGSPLDFGTEIVWYDLRVTVFDAAGGQATVFEPNKFMSQPFTTPQTGFFGGNRDLRTLHMHVVEEVIVDAQPVTDGHLVTVTVPVSFKHGAQVDSNVVDGNLDGLPDRNPAPRRCVAGRLLVARAVEDGRLYTIRALNDKLGGDLSIEPDGSTSDVATCRVAIHPNVQSAANLVLGACDLPLLEGVASDLALDETACPDCVLNQKDPEGYKGGPFIYTLNETMLPDGTATMTFTLKDPAVGGTILQPGDELVFNVETVIEVDESGPVYPDIIFPDPTGRQVTFMTRFLTPYMQWSFPDTTEAGVSGRCTLP